MDQVATGLKIVTQGIAEDQMIDKLYVVYIVPLRLFSATLYEWIRRNVWP